MLMSCWYRLVQLIVIIKGRKADLVDLGHILLHLCYLTSAPHYLQSCSYSLRLIFDAVRNFWQGLNFVM